MEDPILTPLGERTFVSETDVANSKLGITYDEAHLFAHVHRRVRGQRAYSMCNRTAQRGTSGSPRDLHGVVRLGTKAPQIRSTPSTGASSLRR
jgi:hypothetical protein